MEGLYTNQKHLRDYVINGINSASDVSNVYIAVAFFTEAIVVEEITKSDCHVRLVVRLGFPTSPYALKKIINNKNVEIRYFTSASFHPKLYIFGDQVALIGSANLTHAAINSNQEIVLSLKPEDERFTDLEVLFSSYWNEASVLTEKSISEYEKIYNKLLKASKEINDSHNEVIKIFGDVEFSNIERGKPKKTKENIFLESYRRTYQEALTAFNHIQEIYLTFGKRKVDERIIPLRLEIDSFFSFVRDYHATHEKWRETPLGWNAERKNQAKLLIAEWLKTPWPHFEENIVRINYPFIQKIFGSPASIESSSLDELVNALVVLHSFHDRLRFFDGGLETLKKKFSAKNDVQKVKASLTHLLFGKGEAIKRMSDLLFDTSFKLNEFGQANVQELVGWINKENLPVINGRTTKVLRYFGFDVRQL